MNDPRRSPRNGLNGGDPRGAGFWLGAIRRPTYVRGGCLYRTHAAARCGAHHALVRATAVSAHSENRTEREKDAGLSLAKPAECWRARWGFSSLSPATFKLPEAQSELVERHSAMGANLKKLMLAASIAASFLSACGDKAPTPPDVTPVSHPAITRVLW